MPQCCARPYGYPVCLQGWGLWGGGRAAAHKQAKKQAVANAATFAQQHPDTELLAATCCEKLRVAQSLFARAPEVKSWTMQKGTAQYGSHSAAHRLSQQQTHYGCHLILHPLQNLIAGAILNQDSLLMLNPLLNRHTAARGVKPGRRPSNRRACTLLRTHNATLASRWLRRCAASD